MNKTSQAPGQSTPEEDEQWFKAVMGAAQAGIFITQNLRFCYVNPWMVEHFGYTEAEMIAGFDPVDLAVEEERHLLREQMLRRAAGKLGAAYEIMGQRKDGSLLPVMILSAPITHRGRPASVGTVIDLTRSKAAEKRILELAYYDPLTGLPNRCLLEDRIRQAIAVAERENETLALAFIDLDNFKRVNDSLGHNVGDALLRAVGERLTMALRAIDSLARLGGDEFVVVMPDIAANDAADVAQRLLDACAQPFQVAGHALTITPSIGIGLYPDDGKDFETLFKNADTAMYQAKQGGRNTFRFYASNMNVAALEQLVMENDLRSALVNKEFRLDYQPLVNLKTGHIVGAEALLRWQHPRFGLLFPKSFITVAEDSGLINPIGDWVLFEACQQARRWQKETGRALTMAVNVSPVQFKQATFVDVIAGALAFTGLDPALLGLELTELTVMRDAEANLGILESLHRMGIRLLVDDFGTGYSSLACLRRFPVSTLKIDRSFIHRLDNEDDQAIASTIIQMGRNLHLGVVAEGIETEQQLDWLRAQHCDLGQGFLFSRPLPADEMLEAIRRGKGEPSRAEV